MFSRGSRSTGRHARDDRARREQARGRRSLADEREAARELDPPGASGSGDRAGRPEPAAATVPAGPYDSAQAPVDGVARVDLGSLKIPVVPGVEVRVQANQDGVVNQIYLVHGGSALQLGVFAAPRTESIWDEVRSEIRQSLAAEGVAVEEVPGEYGTELRARVRTPQGPKDLRFVGVSGPRWLARAVYQGPAAADPASAGPLAECLRGVVVDRGTEARPVREPLPLKLSDAMAEQVQGAADGSGPAAAGPGGGGVNGATGPVNGAVPAAGGSTADFAPPPPRRRPSPRPRRQE